MRCACGNYAWPGETQCAACQLVARIDAVYRTVAEREVGLRERIAARWPGYDATGWEETAENSPDGLAAIVTTQGEK